MYVIVRRLNWILGIVRSLRGAINFFGIPWLISLLFDISIMPQNLAMSDILDIFLRKFIFYHVFKIFCNEPLTFWLDNHKILTKN